MNLNVAPAVSAGAPTQVAADAGLTGSRLLLARVMWLVVAIVALAMFAASVPYFYAEQRVLSATEVRNPEAVRVGLDQLGIPLETLAVVNVAVLTLLVVVFAAVAGLIFWRKPGDPAALFFSLVLVSFGAIWPNTLSALSAAHPVVRPIDELLNTVGFGSFFLLFYLFPDGRFVPRWTRLLAVLLVVDLVLHEQFTGSALDSSTWPMPMSLLSLLFPLTMLYAQVYRYRKVSTPVQRQQTKWVVFSLVTAIVSFVTWAALSELSAVNEPGKLAAIYELSTAIGFGLSFLLVPIAIGFAVLRYRLWDIDPIINRTLVYAALTAGVVAIYIVVVGWLGVLFQTGSNLLFSLVATGLVAVLFQPMREQLQRGINRLMYGQRDEPYAVVSRLGQRLEGAFAPDAVLSTIVSTISEALKLPYAAITLRQGDLLTVAAATGAPVSDPVRLPLVYQHEQVGELLLAPRSPGETFSPADRRLLEDLARQAGVVAHAVQLNADLQQARERLVEAREEERRRLRRDLHDGLGSQLAALNMELGALRREIEDDPTAADAHVQEIRGEIRLAIANIRQIAHNLRPPVLDDLGLRAALQARVRQYASESLAIDLNLADDLPLLSAASQVAIYRIVEEALTNVARHARAERCTISLAVDGDLVLTIVDDGDGLSPDRQAGVGLLSMRERAEELGGTFEIDSAAGRGTHITARLPLPGT